MAMDRSVSILLITFDSAPYLRRCLSGVLGQTSQPLEIVVIDNASTDGSVAIVRELTPSATIILNAKNRGFAAAANQAIAESRGEFVLLLNPDVYLEPAFLSKALPLMKDPHVGAVTGKLRRGLGFDIQPTLLIDSKGIRMTRSGRHLDIDSERPDSGSEEPREVFGVSGAAALYRRSMLEEVAIEGQPFDEDFFAYREDADLAWRSRLFGWKSMYSPDAEAYHVRRVTPAVRGELPAELNMHSVKNRFLLRWKNEGIYLALRNAPFELARDLQVIVATLTIERTSLPAWRWLWKNRRRIAGRRRAIQARRSVSDSELAHWFGR